MSLTDHDIKKIGHLARLAIADNEVSQLRNDLSRILDLVEQMGQLNTDQVPALAHPIEQAQSLRPDVVTETDQRALFQSIAPKTQAGLYLVPKVIDAQ